MLGKNLKIIMIQIMFSENNVDLHFLIGFAIGMIFIIILTIIIL